MSPLIGEAIQQELRLLPLSTKCSVQGCHSKESTSLYPPPNPWPRNSAWKEKQAIKCIAPNLFAEEPSSLTKRHKEAWDGNPVKSDWYDHYTTTDVINSFEQ